MSLKRFWFGLAGATLAAAAFGACTNPLALPTPTSDNIVDTVTIYALRGTDIRLPSAFDIVLGTLSRTDRAEPFDFAFDFDSTGQAELLPAGALGLSAGAGPLTATSSFDSLVSAPTTSYDSVTAVPITPGQVLVGRSRLSTDNCLLGTPVPRYAKFQVLGVDAQARSATLEALVDLNCGYRSLAPGLPSS
jgi:hypothetical protein